MAYIYCPHCDEIRHAHSGEFCLEIITLFLISAMFGVPIMALPIVTGFVFLLLIMYGPGVAPHE
jgi:hypothetical protein